MQRMAVPGRSCGLLHIKAQRENDFSQFHVRFHNSLRVPKCGRNLLSLLYGLPEIHFEKSHQAGEKEAKAAKSSRSRIQRYMHSKHDRKCSLYKFFDKSLIDF